MDAAAAPPPPPPPPAAAPAAAPPTEWDPTNKSAHDIADENRLFVKSLSRSELERRTTGDYFTRMEELWGEGDLVFGQEHFDAITRSEAQGKLYVACYKYLDQDIRGNDNRSATTNQRGNHIKLDTFGSAHCHSAHLLSHAPVCHKAYGFVGEAAIGKRFGRTRPRRKSSGAPTGNSPAEKRLKMLAGVKNRNGSSLKSHKFNKVYLNRQETYYDTDDPSILIIPLLTLQQVMDWATDATSAIEYDVMAVTFGVNSSPASKSILAFALQECTAGEIENGRSLLQTFLLGLAGLLKMNEVKESFTENELKSHQALARWSSLVDHIVDGTVPKIGVPVLPQARAPVHVAKGRMSLRTSLPDPWLLLLKAAINYSAFRKTTLMPACPPELDDDGPPNTIQGMEMEQPQESFLFDSLKRGGFSHGHILYDS